MFFVFLFYFVRGIRLIKVACLESVSHVFLWKKALSHHLTCLLWDGTVSSEVLRCFSIGFVGWMALFLLRCHDVITMFRPPGTWVV